MIKTYQEVFDEGADDYLDGLDRFDNPYNNQYEYDDSDYSEWWDEGWYWQREKDLV